MKLNLLTRSSSTWRDFDNDIDIGRRQGSGEWSRPRAPAAREIKRVIIYYVAYKRTFNLAAWKQSNNLSCVLLTQGK